MNIETVEIEPRPMLYLTRQSAMDPAAISRTMSEMFTEMGRFIGEKHVPVTGAPLAIYHDHADGKISIDLGFPVAPSAASLAQGDIKAGLTPGGKALKAVHRGPYDRLRDTYGELEGQLRKAGIPLPPRSWEVYLNEPGLVADKDLLTEIYMPVSS